MNITRNTAIDPDNFEAEDYESFDSIYYDNCATDLLDTPKGLYALDQDGLAVGYLENGCISSYMNWVYIYIK